jgi:hypothetical protein
MIVFEGCYASSQYGGPKKDEKSPKRHKVYEMQKIWMAINNCMGMKNSRKPL